MDLSSLNNQQLKAVTAPLGPVLVLAGAGSGKTRALAYRIAYLCENGLAAPDHILALTFTNKAAKEMQERVAKILSGKRLTIPFMGTFHSICARILRREIHHLGYTGSFAIYDSDDQSKIIRDIIQDLHIDKRFSPAFFKSYISGAKNALQTPGEMNAGLEPDLQNLVREVYGRYQDYLFKQNGADFDDLLMLTVKIFQSVPGVLEKYRRQFEYILVDEYQDTNHAQYVLLYILAERHHNLFVVGDDAQSIYGFRGSNIRNILNFEQDFPEAAVVKLEQNYRSTKNILQAAQKVIELNPEQKPKTLWTENEPGAKVSVEELDDERDEGVFVAKKIVSMASGEADGELEYEPEGDAGDSGGFSILDHFLKKAGRSGGGRGLGRTFLPQLPRVHGPLTEFAVLYRTHAQSRALEEAFIECGIPYQIIGGLKFYERKEIKDMLAYLRLSLNYRDLVSLRRVLNEPARGIGERSYQIIKDLVLAESVKAEQRQPAETLAQFRARLKEVKFGPKIGAAVDDFFSLLDHFSALDPEESLGSLLRLVIKRAHYEEWLRDGTETGESRWENVEELVNVVQKYKGQPWQDGLTAFLEEVALVTEIDAYEESKDLVTLMTLHSAKGLEFDTVFLVGLEEGVLPHSRSLLEPSELSEEIRLAYVGLTRARKRLFLTFARRRLSFGSYQFNQPSRILRALPKDKIAYHGSGVLDRGEGGAEELDF